MDTFVNILFWFWTWLGLTWLIKNKWYPAKDFFYVYLACYPLSVLFVITLKCLRAQY